MSVTIKKVESKADLRKFVRFPEKLYRKNNAYVPALVFDEMDTLNPKKNPSAAFCDSALYLAYKNGALVGRVAAIVNNKANEQWNHKEVRFGWYDFIDDEEVSSALMDKVVEFGKERNMEYIVGPLGFTDFDPEGMLVEGFDALNTMPLIYNAEYYHRHVESLGFRKDADWLEYKIFIPETLPDRVLQMARIIEQRSNVHVRKMTRRIVMKEGYGRKIFHLINETYQHLYNYTILPEDLSDKYLGFYMSVLDLKYVVMLENEKDELVGFAITMPSLARALQKSRGKLFPFGWIHILRSLYFKHEEGVELLLIGVRPDYVNYGLPSLMMTELFQTYIANGVKWAETNAELETNTKIRALWKSFDSEQKKRRRSYIREI